MRQNGLNIALFIVLLTGITTLWWYAEKNWLPKPVAEKKETDKNEKSDKSAKSEKPTDAAIAAISGEAALARAEAQPPKVEPKPPERATSQAIAAITGAIQYGVLPPGLAPPTLVRLGGPGFFNQVLLTTQGAGMQQVVLSDFYEADRLGREAKKDGQPVPLYLIPGVRVNRGLVLREDYVEPDLQPGPVTDPDWRFHLAEPSYTLFQYATADDKYPDPLLGRTNWTLVEESRPENGDHRVVFEKELPAPYSLRIRKIYTLGRKDYHVGLKVEFKRTKDGQKGKGQFRYQISGPRGIPVEGEWYTSTTRIALVGWESKNGRAFRQYEDAATIGLHRGGELAHNAAGEAIFKYTAISTQYFASALAIDDSDGTGKTLWSNVRATSELPFIPSPEEIKNLEDELKTNPKNEFVLAQLARVRDLTNRKLPELDDITFRAIAAPIDLEPGEELVHTYAIYNGPSKVRLLKLLEGERTVDPALVDRYLNQFGLRTITDFNSPTWFGRQLQKIYWTDLLIAVTNLMHGLLWVIHNLVGSWGLSIILLTVIVKMILHVPSRKQMQMSMKMQEVQKRLKPEIDKLHEKYKDDFQTFNTEKTRLMMKHGFHPFSMMSGCLLAFAQAPVFMGLYCCLQESVFFRLEPFLWMNNLAAPDMTLWWGEGIPLISDPENRHGGTSFLYLGPYLNILPLIAVGLMMYQQHKTMPPPTDEQTAANQKAMKFVMFFMAFVFYKFAAGLAIYFIIGSIWGIIERQFIPKPKLAELNDFDPTMNSNGKNSKPGSLKFGVPEKPKGMVGRFRARMQEKLEELQKQAAEQSSRQVKNAANKPDPFRRDGKKKKRK